MGDKLILVMTVILALALGGLLAFGQSNIETEKVLAETVVNIPDPSPVPTITPTPTPTTIPSPKPTPTPTPIPKPVAQYTSEQIYGFTQQYGGEYGVDPNVIRHIAICESGFNPAAKYYIYGGLFQFSSSTWSAYRKKMNLDPDPNLRYDAQEAVKTAAYLLSLGGTKPWPNCQP